MHAGADEKHDITQKRPKVLPELNHAENVEKEFKLHPVINRQQPYSIYIIICHTQSVHY